MKNIVLLVRCIARACLPVGKTLVRGRADRVPKRVSRIIVAPDGKLGDVVCVTPVLAAVRKHFPQARVIIGGNSALHKALLADSGLADEYLDLGGAGNAVERIKECRADAALFTGPSYESVAFAYLAGVPLIVAPVVQGGFSPYETRSYKILQRFITTFPYQFGAYAPRERLRVLEPLGIVCDDTTKHLGFSESADKKIKQFFIANSIDVQKDFVVGISPSAGNKIKEWPEERFAQVADHLIEKHRVLMILIGGSTDGLKVQKVIRHMRNPGAALNTQGQFTLDELKALISKLNLFISVDTGPIYIAEAFDVPTIDITGPIDEREQPPRGPSHRNVTPSRRARPELFVLDARSYNEEEAMRQVDSIMVSAVTHEIDRLLSDMRTGGSDPCAVAPAV